MPKFPGRNCLERHAYNYIVGGNKSEKYDISYSCWLGELDVEPIK